MVTHCICEHSYCELDDLFEYKIKFILKSETERDIQNVEDIINTQVRRFYCDLNGNHIVRVITTSNPMKQITYKFNIYCPNDIKLNQYSKVKDFIIEKMIKTYPQFEFQFKFESNDSYRMGHINGSGGEITSIENCNLYIYYLRNMTQQEFNQILETGINEFHHFYEHNPTPINYRAIYELIMDKNEEIIEDINNSFNRYLDLRVWVDLNQPLFMEYLTRFFKSRFGVSINEVLDLVDMIKLNTMTPFRIIVNKKIIEEKKLNIDYVDIDSLSQKQIQDNRLDDICSICLEPLINELDDDSNLVAVINLKCGHNYHSNCIRQYLGMATCNNECPYCRTNMKMGKLYCKIT